MIKHLSVKGYRLFRDFETDLQPGINVLIGANSSGKSTFAEALRILHCCAERPLPPGLEEKQAIGEPFHPDANGALTLIVQLSLSATPMRFPNRTTPPSGLSESGGRRLYTYAMTIKGATPPVIAAEEVWRPCSPRSGDRIQDGLLGDREAKLGDGPGIIPGEGQYRILRATAGSGEMAEHQNRDTWHLGPNEPMLNRARDPQHYPECSLVRSTLSRWRFYTQIRVDRDSRQRLGSPIAGETVLDDTAGNLLSVLLSLTTNVEYRAQCEELIAFLRAAIPEFETLRVTPDPSGKYAMVQWRERGLDLTLSSADLSDGVLRLLVLGVICCNPYPASLICIDEPEIGLHPKLLPPVGGLLRRAAERSQVMILTHSPDLLYGMPIESIAVMRKQDGEARIVWPENVKLLCELVSEEVAGERQLDPDRLRQAFASGELDTLG